MSGEHNSGCLILALNAYCSHVLTRSPVKLFILIREENEEDGEKKVEILNSKYLDKYIDDSGEEVHADMYHNRYLVNRIHDTTVLGRY